VLPAVKHWEMKMGMERCVDGQQGGEVRVECEPHTPEMRVDVLSGTLTRGWWLGEAAFLGPTDEKRSILGRSQPVQGG